MSFRYHTVRTAARLGVTGWVRNAPDGSVELEVQGHAEDVEGLLAWAESGPPGARVDGLVTTARPLEAGETGFTVVS